jgi:hypothetical protein
MRKSRERQAAGRLLLPIEVDEVELVEVLVAHGVLDPIMADDKAAIARAVERVLEAIVRDAQQRGVWD